MKRLLAASLALLLPAIAPFDSQSAQTDTSARRSPLNAQAFARPVTVSNIGELGEAMSGALTDVLVGPASERDRLEVAGVIEEAQRTLEQHPGPMTVQWDEAQGGLRMTPAAGAPVVLRFDDPRAVAGARALRVQELAYRIENAVGTSELGRTIRELYDGAPIETVGVLREIKPNERRVGLTPDGVRELRAEGVPVVVEKGAGAASGFTDEEYSAAGARLVDTPAQIFEQATLIKHVKELQPSEYALLRPHHIVFTYNHFEESDILTAQSKLSNATFLSYEKVAKGKETPLLAPMSKIAGVLAAYWSGIWAGDFAAMKEVFLRENVDAERAFREGYEELLKDFPAAPDPNRLHLQGKKVVVLGGGGTAGLSAARMAREMGARVAVTEADASKRSELERIGMTYVDARYDAAIDRELLDADAIVGAVYVKGKAPMILDEARLQRLSVARGGRPFLVVDISVDQGGNVAFLQNGPNGPYRSHNKTSHEDPVAIDFFGNRIIRIPNMPAAVPRRASIDLEAATLPYLKAIARGLDYAFGRLPELAGGLSIQAGRILDAKVAQAHPGLAAN